MTAGDTVVRDPRKPRDLEVLTVDTDRRRVGLSIKQAQEPTGRAGRSHPS